MRSAVVLIAVAAIAGAPQTPPRDQPRLASVGSAVISGTVVADDDMRAPLRHATVTLSRSGIEDIRSTTTDDRGRFAFSTLPAGSYTMGAFKSAYVAMSYGAPKPGMPGISLVLADGQTVAAKPIALLRGAVIAGRITDKLGRPVELVSVRADQFVVANGERRRRTSSGATGASLTNAHGEYRIYGLLPGDYALSVTPVPLSFQDEVSPAELAWIAQPAGASPSPPRALIYAPTMFPGTADPAAAVPIAIARGEARLGVDFSIQSVPISRVTGVVTGPDNRPVQGAIVFCTVKEPSQMLPPSGVPIGRTGSDGAFACPGLAPGQCLLSARATATPVAPDAPARPGAAPPPMWGMVEVSASGQDISNVAIRVQQWFGVSGQVVLRSAGQAASGDVSRVQVRLSAVNANPPVVSFTTTAGADGSFQLDGVVPGPYRLTATMQGAAAGASAWSLRSAMLGGKDVADVPINVVQQTSGLVVTLADAPTELAGTLADGAGQPAPQLYVFAFPADKTLWAEGSRRILSVRSGENGSYRIAGLPAGDYYLCALTELDTVLQFDAAYLEQLVPASTRITIADGERKTQNLRIGG